MKRKFIIFGGFFFGVAIIFFAIFSYFKPFDEQLHQTPKPVETIQQSVSAGQKTVLVFWRPGCPYCKAATKDINELVSTESRHDVRVVLINTRSKTGQMLYPKYRVTETPSIVTLKPEVSHDDVLSEQVSQPFGITYDHVSKDGKRTIKVRTGVLHALSRGDF